MDKSLKLLEELVNVDSGTGDQEGREKLAAIIRPIAGELNGMFQPRVAQDGSVHYWFSRGKGPRILLMAHLDTVFPKGTVAERKFRIEGDLAYGPGVSDCKSGVVTILGALTELNRSGWPDCQIDCLFNTDEEISSPGSREFIAELAQGAKAVLVVEPAEGDNVTVARKGIGRFIIKVTGRSAHSGSNYQDGRNAILELAHKIIAVHDLSQIEAGLTFNAGVIRGGIKSNIVPDYAEVEIDLRLKSAGQESKAIEDLRGIVKQQWIPDTTSRLEGGVTRPPMEATPANLGLYHDFKAIADQMGLELGLIDSGGGSDANLAALYGVPTIDGLGPVGGGHHTEAEYMVIPSLDLRTKLLTEFLKHCQNK